MLALHKKYVQAIGLTALILLANCKKDTYLTDDTYFGGKVMILGHTGMGLSYIMPGNTYESVFPAIQSGCDGCEIDIQMTRDSVLVVYHDFTLQEQTHCDGRIIDKDWDEISTCKYSFSTKPISLYSVDELFGRFPNLKDLYFSFDCKLESERTDQQAYEYTMMRAIQRICKKYGMEDHVIIEGPAGFLDKAVVLGMKNKLFLFTSKEADPVSMASKKYSGIQHDMDITAEEIQRAHRAGLYVMLADPDNVYENKSALSMQPDIIQTDDPKSILKLLNRYNYEH